MEQRPSQLLSRLSESATIAMARKATELKQSGVDVISLSLGEPDFDTPEVLKQAGMEAIENNITHYTPVPGLQDVREAICAKFKRDNGLDFTPSQIVVSNGAKQSITNVVLTLVDPGEEVILPAPYWVSYADMVAFAGGTSKILPTSIENDFKIQPDELKAAINDKTRLLIYSSPCNPSGSVYTREEIKALADVLKRHPHVYIISDEIYELINFTDSHCSMGTIEELKDRVITVNGVSKGFAMTGWRLGYIGAPEWIAKACSKIQGQVTSAPCSIAQVAAGAAVSEDPSIADEMKAAFLSRRDLMIDGLSAIPGLKVNRPMGAFYLFPDVSALFGKSNGDRNIATAEDFAMYLLEEAHVATVGGGAFGTPECIRLSYAASEAQLREALARISKAVAALQ
ncbi:MAG: pyridoxal phosphate-dependent aminotransferase [Crocinitomicaceae bacterium TMED209]|nr:MAG: pyridoxal phosphate-dependent aminotransferase [Crocinitomicaceae bacterium TMED209]RPG88618.1 MAG: pyridoxal phosphate-dependent aminotransferase [Crocinitomicaceae bacterium TMED209]|tara:strand:- start:2444 stop:3640 length:1197 start_codon:yes stop_codon:yes gene_type:complete